MTVESQLAFGDVLAETVASAPCRMGDVRPTMLTVAWGGSEGFGTGAVGACACAACRRDLVTHIEISKPRGWADCSRCCFSPDVIQNSHVRHRSQGGLSCATTHARFSRREGGADPINGHPDHRHGDLWAQSPALVTDAHVLADDVRQRCQRHGQSYDGWYSGLADQRGGQLNPRVEDAELQGGWHRLSRTHSVRPGDRTASADR
jgi:hypothetical protein